MRSAVLLLPYPDDRAYAAIANEGEYRQPVSSFSRRCLDADNNVVIDTETDRDVHEAFKPSTAYMLTDILEDAVQEGTGSQARLDGMTTAGKTGTVGDNKGVTFAGYTPYYTSMVWVGHDLAKTIGAKHTTEELPRRLEGIYAENPRRADG